MCSRSRSALLLAASSLLLAACNPSAAPEADSRVSVSEYDGARLLPAFPLPGERKGSAKADQYDDAKNSQPKFFGITGAPKTPVRTVGQWEEHDALLLTWVGSSGVGLGIEKTYAGIVKASLPVVDVFVIHENAQAKSDFQFTMQQHGTNPSGVKYIEGLSNSIWMRDYGPLSVRTPAGELGFVDPRYYHQRIQDDALPTVIANHWGINTFRQPLDWEGGTYIADGKGNCIYSSGVYMFNGISQSQIHKLQRDYLGCETNTVIFPLEEEGTTHSDMFAKMVKPGHFILGEYLNSQDPGNKAVLDANFQILTNTTFNDGTSPTVTRIPMPSNSNRITWRTYANSLLVNGKNLIPVYTDDTTFEAEALAVWQQVLPTWDHVPIDSTALIDWSGAIHCITMTVPSGTQVVFEPAPQNLCPNGGFGCNPSQTQAGSCPVSFEGCCDGGSLQQCDDTGLKTISCGGSGCGYSGATLAYACGGSGAGPANASLMCGVACVPDCTGSSCGSDGCGGSCGDCGNNEQCISGSCESLGPADPCGGITILGCCDGSTLKFCENSVVNSQGCPAGCGWDASGGGSGWYDCGFSGSDPGGTPKACPSECTPDCSSKNCGNDGCGGSCGSCGANQQCQAGQCAATCVPSCSGNNACGPDKCGSSCGSCSAGQLCETGQCKAVAGCGDIGFAGECQANTLVWCEDGAIKNFDCVSLSLTCGAVPDSDPIDFDCIAEAGCTPQCDGKACGANGCGGVCGVCNEGLLCNAGQCADMPTDPCNGLTFEGCCDGEVLNWCEGGAPTAANCDGGGCGWNSAQGYYDCNQSGDGPAEFPKECGGTACVPDCSGTVCGSNGCGGTCGTCSGGTVCDAGQCTAGSCGNVSFEGACSGSTLNYCDGGEVLSGDCNQDGSGACCGWDDGGQFYNCVEAAACSDCIPECAPGEGGCSIQGTHQWSCKKNNGCDVRAYLACADGCEQATSQCKDDGPPPCEPSCDGKICGGDGCGGSCGNCGAGESCNASGQCVASCSPDCSGKQCGDDGCGGECGPCEAGLACKLNQCVSTSCQAQCDGKACGDDGCGGSCGACEANQKCNKEGLCVAKPDECVPACDGKACGPDGCSGACGVCNKDQACSEGQCLDKPNSCGPVTKDGMCEGDTLRFCKEGQLSEVNCAELGLSCGANGTGGFDCVDPDACVQQCVGKVCGDDGCGGVCGDCPKDGTCTTDGQCVSNRCVPQCDGKQCGADGCGGLCGTCGAGMACNVGVCEASDTCPDGSLPVDGKCPGDDGTGGDATGGDATGGDATGGDATGGDTAGTGGGGAVGADTTTTDGGDGGQNTDGCTAAAAPARGAGSGMGLMALLMMMAVIRLRRRSIS